MKRTILVSLLSILVLAGLGATVFIIINGLPPAFVPVEAFALSETTTDAMIVESVGDTVVLRDGETVDIDGELVIQEGDEITVAEDAEATLYWVDGSLSRMTGPAALVVTSMHFTEKEMLEVDMEIKTGDVWTKVLNMLTEESTVQIRTQSTVAGIRGTILRHQVSGTGTVITPYEHAVHVQTIDETEDVVVEGEVLVSSEEGASTTILSGDEEYQVLQQSKDKTYIDSLAKMRREKMIAHKTKYNAEDIARFVKQMNEKGERPTEQVLTMLLDYYASSIADAYEKGDIGAIDRDTKKYSELLAVFDVSSLTDAQREKLVRQIDRHARALLVDDFPLDLLTFKEIVTKEKVAIAAAGNNDEVLRRILTKEVYYGNDLRKRGENVAAEVVISGIQLLTPVMRPLFQNVHEREGRAVQVLLERIESGLPNAQGASRNLQNTIFPDKIKADIKKAVMERDQDALRRYYSGLSAEQQREFLKEYPAIRELLVEEEVVDTVPVERAPVVNQNTNATKPVNVLQPVQKEKTATVGTKVITNANTNKATVEPTVVKPVIKTQVEPVKTPIKVAEPVIKICDPTPPRTTLSTSR